MRLLCLYMGIARALRRFTMLERVESQAALSRRFLFFVRRNPIYFALLLLVSLALIKNSPLLLQDLPDWVQQAQQLSARLFGGHIDPRIALKPYPVPNSSSTVLIALVGTLTGFELGAKIVVLATTWVLGILTARLMWMVDPENAQYKSVAALSVLVLSSSLFNGYISYQIGLTLFFSFLYWYFIKNGRSPLLITAFGTAIFFSHGAVFVVFAICVLVLALNSKERWPMLASLAFPGLLVLWYALGERHLAGHRGGETIVRSYGSIRQWAMYKAYTFCKLGPFHNFELASGRAVFARFPIVYLLGIGTNVIVAAAFATHAALALKNALSGRMTETGRMLALIGLPIILLAFILPPSVHNLVNPGERLLIPAIGLVLALPGIKCQYWKPLAGLVAVGMCSAALFFLKADTNYNSVMKARQEHLVLDGDRSTQSTAADFSATEKANGQQPLFVHDAYRFFYIYNVMRSPEIARLSFDSGLFYVRPGFDRVKLSPVGQPLEQRETPALSYLGIPVPKGAYLPKALWSIDEAKRDGWDGVETGIGTYNDPDNIDMSGLQAAAELAAKDKLRMHLRLLQAVDAEQKINGSFQPSKWAVRYNGGEAWSQPYRLPKSVAVEAAKRVWQKAIDTVVLAYKSAGLEPTQYVSAEGMNEAGIGGANGPGLGRWSALRGPYDAFKHTWKDYLSSHNSSDYERAKSDFLKIFPESLWNNDKPLEEGSIEPDFFTELRSMLAVLDDRGIKIYPLTLEGEYGKVGQHEIDSYTGPDVAWIASKYGNRAGFNRFMTSPAATPDECGENYAARAHYQIDRMRKNPFLSGDLFNTEFGMENLPSSITGNYDIAEGRQAILTRQRNLEGIVGGGFFISISTNKLASGFNLFDDNQQPIGKFAVGPVRIKALTVR
jgi:hypothetical protein